MNKKSILRMVLYLVVGGFIGVGVSTATRSMADSNLNVALFIENILMNYLIHFQVALILLVMVPALYYLQKGKKCYKELQTASEDDINALEISGDKSIDLAITLNMSFIILSYMLFGIAFSDEMPSTMMLISIGLFIVCVIPPVFIEFAAIKAIQINDKRIKGDPSKFSFHKEYLESCDEAEQLRIYKAAYQSFQMTKGVNFVCLLLAMLGNMLLETGILPILLTGTTLLIMVLSYGGFARAKEI